MGKVNYRLNDLKVRLIGIPVVALIMTFTFHEGAFLSTSFFISWGVSMLFTGSIWESNRWIFIQMRIRFSEYSQTTQRVIWQTTFSLLATTFLFTFFYLMEVFVFELCELSWKEFLSHGVSSIIPTSIITIWYEARYFLDRWKDSLKETEDLKRINLSSQLQSLKDQVNPHFLFNSLNTLSALIQENPKLAEEFVQKFSRVYRYVLENKEKDLVTIEEEMKFLENYYFLHKIRFGENILMETDMPDQHLKKQIPPLSLQLLFENAVKHNVISGEKRLKITIKANGANYATISNNLQEKLMPEESMGLGLNNIRDRYRHFTQSEVIVNQSADSFQVSIPLLETNEGTDH